MAIAYVSDKYKPDPITCLIDAAIACTVADNLRLRFLGFLPDEWFLGDLYLYNNGVTVSVEDEQ